MNVSFKISLFLKRINTSLISGGTPAAVCVFLKNMKWSLILILSLLVGTSGLYAQSRFPLLRAHPKAGYTGQNSHRVLPLQALQDSTVASIFPNINVTNDPLNDQNEPSISIDPLDPLEIVIGGVDDRSIPVLWYYATTNGGSTWHNESLPSAFFNDGSQEFSEATDPGVVFDQSGTLYFSNVFLYFKGSFTGANEEACYSSTNNGQSWQPPVYVGGDTGTQFTTSVADRDYITVDRDSNSPYFGRLYIVWVTIQYPKSVIVESHSTDHGASWSLPVSVSSVPISQDTVLFQGPIPACGPMGELYVTFEDRDSTSKQILVARSLNGGVSFAPQVAVSSYRELGQVIPDNFNGHPTVKDSVETNSFPSIAVDRSNRHRGRIYVTWCGRDADSNAHVFLSASDDSGKSWIAAHVIDNDSSTVKTDKFLPWVAVDQSAGDVGVTFYDSRNDPNANILIDDYLSLSTDGGESFTARRISSVSSDPRICRDVVSVDAVDLLFFGDYISLDAMDSVWYPTWTDTRSGSDQDIYMSVIQPFAPKPVTNLAANDTIVNGKHSAVIAWQYVPETTFGYPLPVGYGFSVARNGTELLLLNPDSLHFVDTNAEQGSEYEVTVLTGAYRSRADSVLYGESGVIISNAGRSSVRFTQEPAIAGREDKLIVDCGESCSVSLTFYDELGREIGTAISDADISTHHELPFTQRVASVKFFVLKESNSFGTIQSFGKISVIEP